MGGVRVQTALVGRNRELTQLRAALSDVLEGSGRFILINGETGVGKTRLVEELALEGRERGANVAWGRCWSEAGAPDLWPWIQVIRACLRAVDEEAVRQLVGPHGSELTALVASRGADLDQPQSPFAPASRFRQFNAIAHLLDAHSSRVPLIVILEDLHQSDASSLLLLQFLTQEQRQRRILLIGTYREPGAPLNRELTQMVAEVIREPGTDRIRLGALSTHETEALLSSRLSRAVPSQVVDVLQRRTGGNPLFLIECLRLLADHGEEQLDRQAAATLPIPDVLREVLEQRLECLTVEQRAVLALAAACGEEFVSERVHAAGADAKRLRSSFLQAETLGILRRGAAAESWQFVQGMMREWLLSEGPDPDAVGLPPSPPEGEAVAGATVAPGSQSIFRREGEYWALAFAGRSVLMRDAKGLAYVAFLLRQPHAEVHVSELVNLAASAGEPASESMDRESAGMRLGLGDAGTVIDGQAKAAYRTRLEELRAELQEAESFHDIGRSERARLEIDFLMNELASATGLGGRDRRIGSAAERARVNVTRSILRVLARIEESAPSLAAHLRRTIKTGTFCSYAPEAGETPEWEL